MGYVWVMYGLCMGYPTLCYQSDGNKHLFSYPNNMLIDSFFDRYLNSICRQYTCRQIFSMPATMLKQRVTYSAVPADVFIRAGMENRYL
jgi:hypothetical protein